MDDEAERTARQTTVQFSEKTVSCDDGAAKSASRERESDSEAPPIGMAPDIWGRLSEAARAEIKALITQEQRE